MDLVAGASVKVKGQKGDFKLLVQNGSGWQVSDPRGNEYWIPNSKITELKPTREQRQLIRERYQHECVETAVEYLLSIIAFVELQEPCVKTDEQLIEWSTFYKAHTGDDLNPLCFRRIEKPWGCRWCVVFPKFDQAPPIPVAKSGGHRGPQDAGVPLLQWHSKDFYMLCNTAVTLRLIEKGLRFRSANAN